MSQVKHIIRKFASIPSFRLDVAALLKKPSWSIRTPLPPSSPTSSSPQPSSPNPASHPATDTITSAQLQHLSTLSALRAPTHPDTVAASLRALQAHVHFVSTVRDADTTGIAPLRSFRDETAEGERAMEFGMTELRKALENEEVVGKFHRRIRRRGKQVPSSRHKTSDEVGVGERGNDGRRWDVLSLAEKKVGRYFVVERGRNTGEKEEGGMRGRN